MLREVRYCPYCGSSEFSPELGAFLEIGGCDGDTYDSEGDADAYLKVRKTSPSLPFTHSKNG